MAKEMKEGTSVTGRKVRPGKIRQSRNPFKLDLGCV